MFRLRIVLPAMVLLLNSYQAESSFAAASDGPLCFPNVPAIRYCIEGRLRAYWQENGGLPVFGYPTTPPQTGATATGPITSQFFERNRLELHPENPPPYDVLLGRLGDARLQQQQRPPAPRETQPAPGCLWFAVTGHSVCDVQPGLGFKTYWTTHGLATSQLDPYARSLALFGLPLTAWQMEPSSSGKAVLTQWFERARFEYHPENPRPFQVLLGLIGNEVQAVPAFTPVPAGTSGLAISVLIGPTCGGPEIEGRDCEDRPYQATIALLTATRTPLRQFQSDAQGRYQIALDPGTYILVPQSAGKYPQAGEQTVQVRAGQLTQVTIHYDSGIR